MAKDRTEQEVTTNESIEKEKIIALFQFIQELNKLKQKPIMNINQHIWSFQLSDIPNDPDNIQIHYLDRVEEEVTENDNNQSMDSVLLSVHKPNFQMCPEPGERLINWLEDGWDDHEQEAVIKEKITLGSPIEADKAALISEEIQEQKEDDVEYFINDKDRVSQYNTWLILRQEWVDKQKVIAKTRHLFEELYRMYFELERESETEEIIVANGMLCDAENSSIKHPVLTHRVKLHYDADENTVSIINGEVTSELYSTVIQALEDINLSTINDMNADLQKNDYHPLDRNDTPIFLKTLVHQLSSSSIFSENGIPSDWKEKNRLLIYLEPCYIVRKRLDGTLKAIQQIIEHVEENGEVPAPLIDLVSGGKNELPKDTGEESIEEQLAAVGGESIDILLSKEANKEQLEIARRIENYNAVLVQGPPGTGKTHTIANLMGHFLAQGKSVLVTSHTTKALSVLKEKVTTGLQSLCVSVLDDSSVDMERSIDGITSYMSRTTSYEMKREMDLLAVQRKDIMKKLGNVRRNIFRMINQECNCIVLNGEDISPTKAAQFVVEHAEELSYIPGKVRLYAGMPLSFEQLTELYRSNEEISPQDEEELESELPSPSEIMNSTEFEETWNTLQSAERQLTSIEERKSWKIANLKEEQRIVFQCDFGTFTMNYTQSEPVIALKEYVDSFGKSDKWMQAVAVDGKKGGAFRQRWTILIEQIEKTCMYAEKVLTEQFGMDVTFKDSIQKSDLQGALEAIKQIYEKKGKISKFTTILHKEYASALASVSVNGKEPQTAKDCEVILHLIEMENLRKQCGIYWDQLFSQLGVPCFAELDKMNPEMQANKWIPQIERCLDWYQTSYQPLLDKLSQLGIPSEVIFVSNALDSDMVATEKILSAVDNIIPDICDVCLAVEKIDTYSKQLTKNKAILQSGKRGDSKGCLALLKAMAEENMLAYAEAYGSLDKLFEKYKLQEKRAELLKMLEPIAPDWAEAIRKRRGVHGNSVVPNTIEDAWKWKQLSEILEDITKQPFTELQAESLELSKEYRKITADYAEKCGWYHLLQRTEVDIDMKQALQGWKQTVRKIGKGTGKNAPALKAKARELMAKCQKAVPGWIMSINRALESLDPKVNRFDVVIIDEASQSDVSSLAILYMGKKLIIVGDDKQVSPMGVGIQIDQMNALEQMFIKDKIPNSHLYNAKTSIYDLAATTFQPLMLREHFRCVPEIIGFSNQLSYDYKIKPLRDDSNSVILPAVVNYRVANGERIEGRKCNPNEAKAIVALMKACIEQEEYKNKTFGVISLLGNEQVKEIQCQIEQNIDAKEIMNRQILCGNSAHFQGDERDIIFLSVVDSNGTGPIRLMTYGNEDSNRKRYNVAASRARDQLWVVNSLDPVNDLKPGDIRKQLIDYAINPNASLNTHDRIEKEADSPFEVAVVTALSDRGYHIVQQWKVGAYRLDIVVVCGNKKVAIECDGERWHSGEAKIREDMERQTILERLGWRFIRIRGSEYYSDPEKTIDRVISQLSKNEIEPEVSSETIEETRDTELLARVKNRAAAILAEESEEEVLNADSIIAYALDKKVNSLFELE